MAWKETRIMGLNQAIFFSSLQPAAVFCHCCILGSSEIKSLCPGGCAACLLPSYNWSPWGSPFLVVRIVVLASSPRACSALQCTCPLITVASFHFPAGSSPDLHCRIRTKLLDYDNSCFLVGYCSHKRHKVRFLNFKIKWKIPQTPLHWSCDH